MNEQTLFIILYLNAPLTVNDHATKRIKNPIRSLANYLLGAGSQETSNPPARPLLRNRKRRLDISTNCYYY